MGRPAGWSGDARFGPEPASGGAPGGGTPPARRLAADTSGRRPGPGGARPAGSGRTGHGRGGDALAPSRDASPVFIRRLLRTLFGPDSPGPDGRGQSVSAPHGGGEETGEPR